MKKLTFLTLICSLFVVSLYPISAKKDAQRPKGLEDKGPLTKITFIHYKKNNVKPPGVGGGKKDKDSQCYTFLSKGAKWKTTEDYEIDADNPDGLVDQFVRDAVELGVSEWEQYGGEAIFGNSSWGEVIGEWDAYDEKNTVSFGDYGDSRVIAVTNIWGYFGGPPGKRELVEWDMLFNTGGDWTWGDADLNSSLMDLQNIATHELGHSAGMGDLYDTACDLETMYGYSEKGDMVKRDLYNGDIVGIENLYK